MTPTTESALLRARLLRGREPVYRKDPHAWAAWQARMTSMGVHGAHATARLMEAAPDVQAVWSELVDASLQTGRSDAVAGTRPVELGLQS